MSTTTGWSSPSRSRAADVGELDVEQDHVRPMPAGGGDGRPAVRRLPDHLEAARGEQPARQRAELGVVVDDHQGRPHAAIVAGHRGPNQRATPAAR
jgi:hypothetical protein